MIYCANCGKQLEDDANFCPKCGTRTEKGVKEGVNIPWGDTQIKQELDKALSEASKALDEGVKVARVTLQDVGKRINEEVQNARDRSRERTQTIHCTTCGQENMTSAKFCSKCGAELK